MEQMYYVTVRFEGYATYTVEAEDEAAAEAKALMMADPLDCDVTDLSVDDVEPLDY